MISGNYILSNEGKTRYCSISNINTLVIAAVICIWKRRGWVNNKCCRKNKESKNSQGDEAVKTATKNSPHTCAVFCKLHLDINFKGRIQNIGALEYRQSTIQYYQC